MKPHPLLPVTVTEDGRIFRLNGTEVKQRKRPDGYMMVSVNVQKGYSKHPLVHRVVLEAFHGLSGLDTRHLDGDRANNHINNLKWGTKSENMHDQVRHGRHKPQKFKYDQEWLRSEVLRLKLSGLTHRGISKELGISKSRIGVISLSLRASLDKGHDDSGF